MWSISDLLEIIENFIRIGKQRPVSYRWNNFIVVRLKSNQACKQQIPQLCRIIQLFYWKTGETIQKGKNRFNICTDESIIQYIPLLYTGIQYIRRAAVTEKQPALESLTRMPLHQQYQLCSRANKHAHTEKCSGIDVVDLKIRKQSFKIKS